MKTSFFDRLIRQNVLINICAFFTLATMLDLILCVAQGVIDTSFWHLGMRFILCACVALSLLVFRHFENLSLLAMLLIHFLICILIIILAVWITGFYAELSPNAYRDAVRTILIAYPVLIVCGLVVDGVKTMKANRILKNNNLN